jgi:WD40 repeat protein
MIDDISFSGDGRYLALGTDSPHVMVFDAETGECISKVNVRWPSRVVAWHPTEPIMAVGVEDKGGAPCSMRMVSFTNLR